MYTSPYNCFVCPTANTKTCLSKNYDECPQKAPFMFIFCLRWKRKRKRIPQFFPCLRRTKCVPHFFVFFARGKKCGTRQKSRDALHATSLARWLLGKTAVSSRKCWARATARQLINAGMYIRVYSIGCITGRPVRSRSLSFTRSSFLVAVDETIVNVVNEPKRRASTRSDCKTKHPLTERPKCSTMRVSVEEQNSHDNEWLRRSRSQPSGAVTPPKANSIAGLNAPILTRPARLVGYLVHQ